MQEQEEFWNTETQNSVSASLSALLLAWNEIKFKTCFTDSIKDEVPKSSGRVLVDSPAVSFDFCICLLTSQEVLTP